MSRRAAAPTIPHIGLGLLLRRLPAGNGNLARACHGELALGRVLVDGRARADVGTASDAHRGHQRGIGADEAVVLDDGAVLCGAVVIARDGAGADVDARAELGVADVGQVVGLRGVAQAARLDLDEVADVHLVSEARARTQARVRPDAAALADVRVLERILALPRRHRHALFHGESDHVGEVILVLRIAVAELREPAREPPAAERHEAGIDFADRAFLVARILFFNDALYAAGARAHDAPIAARIVELGREERDAIAGGLEQAR